MAYGDYVSSRDFDLGAFNAVGIDVPGDGFLYALDQATDEVKVYSLAEDGTATHDTARSFSLHANNAAPHGIAIDTENNFAYVLDAANANGHLGTGGNGRYCYVYSISSSGATISTSFRLGALFGGTQLSGPRGIAFFGGAVYVVNNVGARDTLYKFNVVNEENGGADLDTVYSLVLSGGNDNSSGLTVRDGFAYVCDRVDSKVYGYALATSGGSRDATKDFDFDSANAAGNGVSLDPTNGYFYVIDQQDDKVYVYEGATQAAGTIAISADVQGSLSGTVTASVTIPPIEISATVQAFLRGELSLSAEQEIEIPGSSFSQLGGGARRWLFNAQNVLPAFRNATEVNVRNIVIQPPDEDFFIPDYQLQVYGSFQIEEFSPGFLQYGTIEFAANEQPPLRLPANRFSQTNGGIVATITRESVGESVEKFFFNLPESGNVPATLTLSMDGPGPTVLPAITLDATVRGDLVGNLGGAVRQEISLPSGSFLVFGEPAPGKIWSLVTDPVRVRREVSPTGVDLQSVGLAPLSSTITLSFSRMPVLTSDFLQSGRLEFSVQSTRFVVEIPETVSQVSTRVIIPVDEDAFNALYNALPNDSFDPNAAGTFSLVIAGDNTIRQLPLIDLDATVDGAPVGTVSGSIEQLPLIDVSATVEGTIAGALSGSVRQLPTIRLSADVQGTLSGTVTATVAHGRPASVSVDASIPIEPEGRLISEIKQSILIDSPSSYTNLTPFGVSVADWTFDGVVVHRDFRNSDTEVEVSGVNIAGSDGAWNLTIAGFLIGQWSDSFATSGTVVFSASGRTLTIPASRFGAGTAVDDTDGSIEAFFNGLSVIPGVLPATLTFVLPTDPIVNQLPLIELDATVDADLAGTVSAAFRQLNEVDLDATIDGTLSGVVEGSIAQLPTLKASTTVDGSIAGTISASVDVESRIVLDATIDGTLEGAVIAERKSLSQDFNLPTGVYNVFNANKLWQWFSNRPDISDDFAADGIGLGSVVLRSNRDLWFAFQTPQFVSRRLKEEFERDGKLIVSSGGVTTEVLAKDGSYVGGNYRFSGAANALYGVTSDSARESSGTLRLELESVAAPTITQLASDPLPLDATIEGAVAGTVTATLHQLPTIDVTATITGALSGTVSGAIRQLPRISVSGTIQGALEGVVSASVEQLPPLALDATVQGDISGTVTQTFVTQQAPIGLDATVNGRLLGRIRRRRIRQLDVIEVSVTTVDLSTAGTVVGSIRQLPRVALDATVQGALAGELSAALRQLPEIELSADIDGALAGTVSASLELLPPIRLSATVQGSLSGTVDAQSIDEITGAELYATVDGALAGTVSASLELVPLLRANATVNGALDGSVTADSVQQLEFISLDATVDGTLDGTVLSERKDAIQDFDLPTGVYNVFNDNKLWQWFSGALDVEDDFAADGVNLGAVTLRVNNALWFLFQNSSNQPRRLKEEFERDGKFIVSSGGVTTEVLAKDGNYVGGNYRFGSGAAADLRAVTSDDAGGSSGTLRLQLASIVGPTISSIAPLPLSATVACPLAGTITATIEQLPALDTGAVTVDLSVQGSISASIEQLPLIELDATVDADLAGTVSATFRQLDAHALDATVQGDLDGTISARLDLLDLIALNATIQGTLSGTVDAQSIVEVPAASLNATVRGALSGTVTASLNLVPLIQLGATIQGDLDGTVEAELVVLESIPLSAVIDGELSGTLEVPVEQELALPAANYAPFGQLKPWQWFGAPFPAVDDDFERDESLILRGVLVWSTGEIRFAFSTGASPAPLERLSENFENNGTFELSAAGETLRLDASAAAFNTVGGYRYFGLSQDLYNALEDSGEVGTLTLSVPMGPGLRQIPPVELDADVSGTLDGTVAAGSIEQLPILELDATVHADPAGVVSARIRQLGGVELDATVLGTLAGTVEPGAVSQLPALEASATIDGALSGVVTATARQLSRVELDATIDGTIAGTVAATSARQLPLISLSVVRVDGSLAGTVEGSISGLPAIRLSATIDGTLAGTVSAPTVRQLPVIELDANVQGTLLGQISATIFPTLRVSATVDGSIAGTVEATVEARFPSTQTFDLTQGDFTNSRPASVSWFVNDTSQWDVNRSFRRTDNRRVLYRVRVFPTNGELEVLFTNNPNSSAPRDLSDDFEDNGGFILTLNGTTIDVPLGGDSSSPYSVIVGQPLIDLLASFSGAPATATLGIRRSLELSATVQADLDGTVEAELAAVPLLRASADIDGALAGTVSAAIRQLPLIDLDATVDGALAGTLSAEIRQLPRIAASAVIDGSLSGVVSASVMGLPGVALDATVNGALAGTVSASLDLVPVLRANATVDGALAGTVSGSIEQLPVLRLSATVQGPLRGDVDAGLSLGSPPRLRFTIEEAIPTRWVQSRQVSPEVTSVDVHPDGRLSIVLGPDGELLTAYARTNLQLRINNSFTVQGVDDRAPFLPSNSAQVIALYSGYTAGDSVSFEFTLPSFETTADFQYSLLEPVPVSEAPEVDSMAAVGTKGIETFECSVSGIRPLDNLSAEVVLVPLSNAIHDAETGAIPAYDPKITLGGRELVDRVAEDVPAGLDGVDGRGVEYIFASSADGTAITGDANLPDPNWDFDVVAGSGTTRGTQTYYDGVPADLSPTRPYVIRFRRPVPGTPEVGEDLGEVEWTQEKAVYTWARDGLDGDGRDGKDGFATEYIFTAKADATAISGANLPDADWNYDRDGLPSGVTQGNQVYYDGQPADLSKTKPWRIRFRRRVQGFPAADENIGTVAWTQEAAIRVIPLDGEDGNEGIGVEYVFTSSANATGPARAEDRPLASWNYDAPAAGSITRGDYEYFDGTPTDISASRQFMVRFRRPVPGAPAAGADIGDVAWTQEAAVRVWGRDGQKGLDGTDGVGVEYIFTSKADATVISGASLPDNDWNYDHDALRSPSGATRGNQRYFDGTPPDVSSTRQYVIRFRRPISGAPAQNDDIGTVTWVQEAAIRSWGRDGTKGIDGAEGFGIEYIFTAKANSTEISGDNNLPDPNWNYDHDGLRNPGGAIRGGQAYYDGAPPNLSESRPYQIRFRRAVPATVEQNSNIGEVDWTQEAAVRVVGREGPKGDTVTGTRGPAIFRVSVTLEQIALLQMEVGTTLTDSTMVTVANNAASPSLQRLDAVIFLGAGFSRTYIYDGTQWIRSAPWIAAEDILALNISAITGDFSQLRVTGKLSANHVESENLVSTRMIWNGDSGSIATTWTIRLPFVLSESAWSHVLIQTSNGGMAAARVTDIVNSPDTQYTMPLHGSDNGRYSLSLDNRILVEAQEIDMHFPGTTNNFRAERTIQYGDSADALWFNAVGSNQMDVYRVTGDTFTPSLIGRTPTNAVFTAAYGYNAARFWAALNNFESDNIAFVISNELYVYNRLNNGGLWVVPLSSSQIGTVARSKHENDMVYSYHRVLKYGNDMLGIARLNNNGDESTTGSHAYFYHIDSSTLDETFLGSLDFRPVTTHESHFLNTITNNTADDGMFVVGDTLVAFNGGSDSLFTLDLNNISRGFTSSNNIIEPGNSFASSYAYAMDDEKALFVARPSAVEADIWEVDIRGSGFATTYLGRTPPQAPTRDAASWLRNALGRQTVADETAYVYDGKLYVVNGSASSSRGGAMYRLDLPQEDDMETRVTFTKRGGSNAKIFGIWLQAQSTSLATVVT